MFCVNRILLLYPGWLWLLLKEKDVFSSLSFHLSVLNNLGMWTYWYRPTWCTQSCKECTSMALLLSPLSYISKLLWSVFSVVIFCNKLLWEIFWICCLPMIVYCFSIYNSTLNIFAVCKNSPWKLSFSKRAKQCVILNSVRFALFVRNRQLLSFSLLYKYLVERTDLCSECSWSLDTSELRPYINHYCSSFKDLRPFPKFKKVIICISNCEAK